MLSGKEIVLMMATLAGKGQGKTFDSESPLRRALTDGGHPVAAVNEFFSTPILELLSKVTLGDVAAKVDLDEDADDDDED